MIDSKELALKAARLLDQKGATDIDVIEVAHLTSITDYFVIERLWQDGTNQVAFIPLGEEAPRQ